MENKTEEATVTEITAPTENDVTTTENEVVKTTTVENPEGDKHPSAIYIVQHRRQR